MASLILAFVVDDLEGELARLKGEGVIITMPLIEEEWGGRAFQVRDPTGLSSNSLTGMQLRNAVLDEVVLHVKAAG